MSDEINPFQAPPPIDADLVDPPGKVKPFASGHTRAMWAVTFLSLVMVADMLGIGSALMQIDLLGRAKVGGVSESEATANDLRQGIVGLLQMVTIIGSYITFLMWFHRAHRNLPSLGNRGLKYSPGWAVGAWFVPILNLFRPYQIMAEIWRGSDPNNVRLDSQYQQYARVSSLVGLWWALWIIMNFASQASLRFSMHADSIESLLAGSWVDCVASVISLPAALLAIMVVRRVDTYQEARYRALTQAD
jgi:hypothetical protein